MNLRVRMLLKGVGSNLDVLKMSEKLNIIVAQKTFLFIIVTKLLPYLPPQNAKSQAGS